MDSFEARQSERSRNDRFKNWIDTGEANMDILEFRNLKGNGYVTFLCSQASCVKECKSAVSEYESLRIEGRLNLVNYAVMRCWRQSKRLTCKLVCLMSLR